jgi:hypothetical protein
MPVWSVAQQPQRCPSDEEMGTESDQQRGDATCRKAVHGQQQRSEREQEQWHAGICLSFTAREQEVIDRTGYWVTAFGTAALNV